MSARSGGAVDRDAGGRYGLIARLEERGWAEPTTPPDMAGDDARRKYYALTEAGRDALAEEARRISSLASQPDVVALARERGTG